MWYLARKAPRSTNAHRHAGRNPPLSAGDDGDAAVHCRADMQENAAWLTDMYTQGDTPPAKVYWLWTFSRSVWLSLERCRQRVTGTCGHVADGGLDIQHVMDVVDGKITSSMRLLNRFRRRGQVARDGGLVCRGNAHYRDVTWALIAFQITVTHVCSTTCLGQQQRNICIAGPLCHLVSSCVVPSCGGIDGQA